MELKCGTKQAKYRDLETLKTKIEASHHSKVVVNELNARIDELGGKCSIVSLTQLTENSFNTNTEHPQVRKTNAFWNSAVVVVQRARTILRRAVRQVIPTNPKKWT